MDEKPKGQVQRWLEFLASCLVVVAVALLVLEWLGSFTPKQTALVRRLEWAIVGFLAAQLAFNFSIAESKREFLRRNWLNILALIPIVRVLRAARIFRVGTVLRVFARIEKIAKRAWQLWKRLFSLPPKKNSSHPGSRKPL